MDAQSLYEEIGRLAAEVLQRADVPLSAYTRGYIDALEYLAEWLEQEYDCA